MTVTCDSCSRTIPDDEFWFAASSLNFITGEQTSFVQCSLCWATDEVLEAADRAVKKEND